MMLKNLFPLAATVALSMSPLLAFGQENPSDPVPGRFEPTSYCNYHLDPQHTGGPSTAKKWTLWISEYDINGTHQEGMRAEPCAKEYLDALTDRGPACYPTGGSCSYWDGKGYSIEFWTTDMCTQDDMLTALRVGSHPTFEDPICRER